MLVYAVSHGDIRAAVLILDCAADNGLGEDAGEQERQHRAGHPRQQTACDQTLLHVAGSVAGEAEQMPCVVDELVQV